MSCTCFALLDHTKAPYDRFFGLIDSNQCISCTAGPAEVLTRLTHREHALSLTQDCPKRCARGSAVWSKAEDYPIQLASTTSPLLNRGLSYELAVELTKLDIVCLWIPCANAHTYLEKPSPEGRGRRISHSSPNQNDNMRATTIKA